MAAAVDQASDALRGLTIKELRTQCRARNLSPAGNPEVLKQRLQDEMKASGDCSIWPDSEKPTEPERDKFSVNNYARPAGAQNLGNRVTGRNSSRVSQAPGGASTIVFGDAEPAGVLKPPTAGPAAPKELFSGLGGAAADAQAAAAAGGKPPSGGFKGLSQVSFGDYQLPSFTTQNPAAAVHDKTPAERAQEVLAVDVDKLLKQLMLKDLRNQCRVRNLSPAGGPEQLRQRLSEHMLATGDLTLVQDTDGSASSGAGPQPAPPAIAYSSQTVQQGLSDPSANNNYARPFGQQNVGNFLTGRNSSRVLAPPGGKTTIMLG